MNKGLTLSQIDNITGALSAARLVTFQTVPGFSPDAHVLDRYSWHALMSAAFFASLHVCEVSVRNAVDSALAATYGGDWPWNRNFERSLPNPRGSHFKPQAELLRARDKMRVGATGKVIAELKFAFWCHMFTVRYQERLWRGQMHRCFPNFPNSGFPSGPSQARQIIHAELETLRRFRNRIAHHEPVLTDPLPQLQQSIHSLILWSSLDVADWHATWETVTSCLQRKP